MSIDASFFSDFLPYLSIPITAALVGWGTNILALKMTFYPINFLGIPPYFGWQGIIPSKAKSMAEKSVDMITTKLIRIDEQFDRISPEQIVIEMESSLNRVSAKIVDEVMEAKAPLVWKRLPKKIKQHIYDLTMRDIPIIVTEIMQDVKEHLNELFDLKAMVIEALLEDKTLLNRIFLECGREEFKFIKKSGFYFGFLFGLVQMVIWYFYQAWWILPVAGLVVGYATNWLALKMIFEPLKPKKIGPITFQGLFIKRQAEVAAGYAQLVTANIITSEKIFESILDGKHSEQLAEMIASHIREVVDHTAADYKELVILVKTPKQYEAMKNIAAYSFMEDFPIIVRDVFDYTEERLDIENTLRTKMASLSPEDFAGFLRPIFQEDEWKLIAVGSLLGMLAGTLQYLLFF